MRFCENNVLGTIYYDIYKFWRFAGGITWSIFHFLFIIHKNRKSTRPNSFRGFEVFLKVPVIIIMRFSENNVLGTIYINIYQFWGVCGGWLHGSHFIYCLLFIKTEKVQEHDLY